MKQSIIKYVITDPFAKVFWVRTSAYGFVLNYRLVFTKHLVDANFMSSEKEAMETLKRLCGLEHFVQDETTKVDKRDLVISPIIITYEQDS